MADKINTSPAAEIDALRIRAEQAERRERALLDSNEEARQFLRKRDALHAEIKRLQETHPHSWYVVQEHFARRRADGLSRELDDMRAKLQAANLRANAAEARANAALKRVAP